MKNSLKKRRWDRNVQYPSKVCTCVQKTPEIDSKYTKTE